MRTLVSQQPQCLLPMRARPEGILSLPLGCETGIISPGPFSRTGEVMSTAYHARYFAHELTRRHPPDGVEEADEFRLTPLQRELKQAANAHVP